jgi:hypothetical protein
MSIVKKHIEEFVFEHNDFIYKCEKGLYTLTVCTFNNKFRWELFYDEIIIMYERKSNSLQDAIDSVVTECKNHERDLAAKDREFKSLVRNLYGEVVKSFY